MVVDKLVDYLFEYPRAWVLSGAGISTESGIPDFRSPGGMWDRVDPMENFSVWALYNNATGFFTHGLEMFKVVAEADSNQAHKIIGKLQQKRVLGPVVTQNVDSLHQKGGAFWVYEVHGHFRTATCMECYQTRITMEELIERAKNGEIPPKCHCGGILKPDVILFGDSMPADYFNALAMLHNYHYTDNFIMVIGSSLTVSPINAFPLEFSHMAIINNTPTPMDEKADIIIAGSAGEIMKKVYQRLLDMNEGMEPEILPAGFIPGRLMQICASILNSITSQLKNTGFNETAKKGLTKIYGDVKLLGQLFKDYPGYLFRQPLERNLLDKYAGRVAEMQYEIENLAGKHKYKIEPEMNTGYLLKAMAAICEGNFKAVLGYCRKNNMHKDVLAELAKQFLGTYGLYGYTQNLAGNNKDSLLGNMLDEIRKIISQKDLPVDYNIALHDF